MEVETDGSIEEEKLEVSTTTLVLQTPFNYFMRVCYVNLKDIMARLTELEENNSSLDFEPPLLQQPFTTKALQSLKLQDLLEKIGIWIEQAEKKLDDKQEELKMIKKRHADILQGLESSEMHIFLAIWTMWGLPGRPYLVNLLLRSETFEQFTNFVTPSLLGLFYMVSKLSCNIYFNIFLQICPLI